MTTSLDLILLPLHRQNDHDYSEIPGLFVSEAQGRVARGRSLERLVIHFSLGGTAPLSPKGYKKLVKHLGDIYFKTSGSSTSAMKKVAEWLNGYLFERNKRGAKRAMKSTGYLTMAVFRANRLFLAQCGEVHAYLLNSDGVTHFSDPDQVGRGLGYTRAAPIHYKQVGLASGDSLLISPNPPPIWTNDLLNNLKGLSLDGKHRRLRERIGPDLEAVLICASGRTGELKVLQPEIVSDESIEEEVELGDDEIPAMVVQPVDITTQPERQIPQEDDSPQMDGPSEIETMTLPASRPEDKDAIVRQPASRPPAVTSTGPVEKGREQKDVKPPKRPIVGPALMRIGQATGNTLKQVLRTIGVLAQRMLPDEGLLTVPKNIMAIIAISVPILVVAIAAATYFQRGQGQLYEEYYLQAEYAAEQAIQLSGPNDVRQGWHDVLDNLDQAEAYKVTDDSQALRNYAQSILDNLDSVTRLPFQPALVVDLPDDVVIKRIVAADEDNVLYLLNATDGHVIRVVRSDLGYVVDPEFICEPVPKPLIVGALVDIIPLPLGNDEHADIMGMDANGNLMECIPGGKSPLTSQMPPPDMHWGNPTALEMNSIGLYVLDPVTNAVWIFWSNDNFSELPTLYFDEQIPSMGDVIDLTLNRQDLFLLHEDGHLTTCVAGFPTRCEDPAVINDITDKGQINEMIEDVAFREIQFAPPPDPSIYLLDPDTPAIYHLSVRLTYQRQFRPQSIITEGPATAFTISPKHQVFMAFGNKVFYSPLP